MDSEQTAWLDEILKVDSLTGLRGVIGRVSERLGFPHYVYRGRFPGFQRDPAEICMDGFPPAWRIQSVEGGVDARTYPIRRHALNSVRPILWHEFLPDHPQYQHDLRKHGLVTGLTCPLHAPHGECSSISFATGRTGPVAERQARAALAESQLLVCFAHGAAKRIVEREQRRSVPSPRPAQPPRLSSREWECLRWTATGRRTGDIGGLLGITERTVTFHLANARRKLGAVNTRHAVSKAITLGLVEPD